MALLLLLLFQNIGFADELEPIVIFGDNEPPFSERLLLAPTIHISPPQSDTHSSRFEDLFRSESSIQVRTESGPNVSLRGSAQAGRVLLLLNEIPLNFNNGLGGSPLFIPNEILGNIQVHSGPTSSTYGAPAMAGAVHFKTQRLQKNRLRVSLAEEDRSLSDLSTQNISVATPLINKKNSHLQLSGFYQKNKGDFTFEENGQPQERANNASSMNRFVMTGEQKEGRWTFSEVLLYAQNDKETPGALNAPFLNLEKSHASLIGLSSRYQWSDRTQWSSQVSWNQLHSNFFAPDKSHTNSSQGWVRQNIVTQISSEILSSTSLDWNMNYFEIKNPLFPGSNIDKRFGAAEASQSFLYETPLGLSLEPQIKRLLRFDKTLLALYTRWELRKWTLTANFSQGYRPPSLLDLFFTGFMTVANPNLLPEQSELTEIGSSYSAKKWKWEGRIFWMEFKDGFASQSLGGGLSTKVNVNESRSHGFSQSLAWKHQKLRSQISYNYLDTLDKDQNRSLFLSPRHQITWNLQYSFSDKIQGHFRQVYWDHFIDFDVTSPNPGRVSSWSGTDLFLQWTHKDMIWTAGVYNLFDRPRQLSFSYPEPQRRFQVSLQADF